MTAALAWQIASWLVASVAGGLLVAYTYGRRVGGAQAILEGLARKVEQMDDDVDDLSTKAETARKSRERIHRDMDEAKRRLDAGDAEFRRQMTRLAEHNTKLSRLVADLQGIDSALGQLVRRGECEIQHKAIDHRLDALERQAGG